MNPSKKKFTIGLAILGALLAGATAFLLMRKGELTEARESLESEISSRGSLAGGKVFPSPANLQKLETQRKALQQVLDETRASVSNRQVQAIAVTGTKFNDLLESTRKAIVARAAKKMVPLNPTEPESPENLAPVNVSSILHMDSKSYAAVSPKDENAPRLTIQMKTLEMVVNSLIDTGVSAVVGFEREKFEAVVPLPGLESPAPAPARSTTTSSPPPPVLESNTYTIAFHGAEPVVWQAVTNLQNLPIAPVVTQVSFRNLNKSLQFSEGAESGGNAGVNPLEALFAAHAAKPAAADTKSVDPLAAKKLVAGTELVEAQVTFKVYQLPMAANPSGN
jgi:hypothetical protein